MQRLVAAARPLSKPTARGARRLFLVALFLVGFLIVTAFFAFAYARLQPTLPYLTAATAIPAGTVLSAEDLSTIDLAAGSVPGAILASDQARVVGEVVSTPLLSGDLLMTTHVCPSSSSITCVLLSGETRLFALVTQGIVMPPGLAPGDKIDLYLTLHDPSGPLCTLDVVAGLTIEDLAPDGSWMTFQLPSEDVSLLISAQHSGDLEIVGAPPTEAFAVLTQGITSCPTTSGSGAQPTPPRTPPPYAEERNEPS